MAGPAAFMSRSFLPVVVGTYPAEGAGAAPGHGEGIWLVDAAGADRPRGPVLALPAPTFLAAHPSRRRLYAVSETDPGVLTTLAPSPSAGLAVVDSRPSGGSGPCHVVLDDVLGMLAVSHYGDGVVAVFALRDDGGVRGGPVLLPPTGTPGPRADRQDGPHAHAGVVSPDRRYLLVADLGTDELRRYRLAPGAPPEADGTSCVLPRGSGPRHLAFGGGRGAQARDLYVTLELSAEVAALQWDSRTGTAELRGTKPLVAAETAARAFPSHLVARRDRLYAAVRGPDVLVTYRIADDGGLEHLSTVPTVGWPRHFAVVGDWLVVAGERAGLVGRHRIAPSHTAEPPVGPLLGRVEVPAPACVVDAAGWPA